MKKTAIYTFVTLIVALTVFSCVQPLEPPTPRLGEGTHQLQLKVTCQAPSTKAFENYPNGETALNENKVDCIDWFIFRDTTSGTPVLSGRDSIKSNDGTTEFFVTTQNMDQYLSTYEDGKGYVLAIANYPSEEEHDVFDGLTFAEIREMELVTEELGNLANGQFTKLNNFVMSSYAEPFELIEDTPVTVNAKLHRLAAKISLNISIVPYIDEIKAYVTGLDTTRIEYVQSWYPDVANIRAYMTYANKHTTLTLNDTLKTDAEVYNDQDFFTYNSRGYIPEVATNSQTGVYTVTGTPFYSYPMKWDTSDPHAPFIKIILKWEGYYESNTVTSGGGHYITHSTGGTHAGDTVVVDAHNKQGQLVTKSQNFYYKITIPAKKNILHSNVWMKINLDVAVLGGVDEEQTVEVIGRYYVVDWNDPGVEGGGDLTAGKYLSLSTARDTFYIYGGSDITIPVNSSHPITAQIARPTSSTDGYRWRNNAWEATNRGDSLSITNNGRSSFTFHNGLNTTMSSNLDCYQMKFNVHLSNEAGLEITKDIVIIQQPSIYVDQKAGGNVFIDGYYGRVDGNTHGDGTGGGTNYIHTPYGNLWSGTITGTNGNLTIISVSAFGESSKNYSVNVDDTPYTRSYVIADPRQSSGFDATSLVPYYNGSGTSAWDEQATKIKIGNQVTPYFIAPKLIVASKWGRQGSGNEDYETTYKRCATYQEAGYPAGRWRLPTEAEVNFMMQLQKNGIIGELFNTNPNEANNWIADKHTINYTGNISSTLTNNRTSRCVYDAWYWGDAPVAGAYSTYTIAP